MKTYNVTITKYHYYTVKAEDENEAEKLALKDFISDMSSPIADTTFDDLEMEEIEDDEK